jgi:ATP-dependent RNA helicase DHX29
MTKPQEEWMETQAEALREKIKSIEGDYTFRKVDAEKLYREERTKLDAGQLTARLNGTTVESLVPKFPTSIATPSTIPEETSASTTGSSPPSPSLVNGHANGTGEVAGGGAETANEEGGFFGNLLEEMPTEETTEQGTTVPIRNLSLPKHFSGKTPKVSLEETVRKLDKPATVKFLNLTKGSSRAVRASVTIRWSDGRLQQWEMTDIACWEQPQAFNYVATLALFAVAGQTAVNKQLPTVFRDLWDELVARKKEEDEQDYREKLKLYKKIAEPRLQEQASKVSLTSHFLASIMFANPLACVSQDARTGKGEKTTIGEEHQIVLPTEISPEASQRIQQEILARQTWPSYQDMLVRLTEFPTSHDGELIQPRYIASTSQSTYRSLPIRDHEDYRKLAMYRTLRRDWMVRLALLFLISQTRN